jgi:hypothetical protein
MPPKSPPISFGAIIATFLLAAGLTVVAVHTSASAPAHGDDGLCPVGQAGCPAADGSSDANGAARGGHDGRLAVVAATVCGDGVCSGAAGETFDRCPEDCLNPAGDQVLTADGAVLSLPDECLAADAASLEECRLFLEGIGAASVCGDGVCDSRTGEAASACPADCQPTPGNIRALARLDGRCVAAGRVNLADCRTWLRQNAREAVSEACLSQGIGQADDCVAWLRAVADGAAPDDEATLDAACVALAIDDEADCAAFLADDAAVAIVDDGEVPRLCAAHGVTGAAACEEFLRRLYLPAGCRAQNETDILGCLGYLAARAWPDACLTAGVSDEATCAKLAPSGVAAECRLRGYFTDEACARYWLTADAVSGLDPFLPSPCLAAQIADGRACRAYLLSTYRPDRCRAAGLTESAECQTLLAEAELPAVCRIAGLTAAGSCDAYLRGRLLKPACAAEGIDDDAACAELSYRRVAAATACAGLTSDECAIAVKSRLLGLVVEAHGRLAGFTALADYARGHDGRISMAALRAESPTLAELAASALPLVMRQEQGMRAWFSAGGVAVTDADEVLALSPLIVSMDGDGDGVPDDVERRHGLDPQSPQTESGTPDGAALAALELTAGIDLAMAAGHQLGEPRTGGELDERLTVAAVDAVSPTEWRAHGRGLPGEVLTLYLYGDLPLVTTAAADEAGDWSVAFGQPVTDGVHELYAAVSGESGDVARRGEPFAFVVQAGRITGLAEASAAETTGDAATPNAATPLRVQLRWLAVGMAALIVLGLGLAAVGSFRRRSQA